MLVVVKVSFPGTCSRVNEKQVKKMVNISGVYQLEDVDNYGEYLMAMDIPEKVAKYIVKLK